jgi:hypothetical protein
MATRGSAKLSAAATLKAKFKGAKIIDWHELGKPNPEVVIGSMQVPVADMKATVATLTKLKELRDLNVLIRGTPRPDIAQINFTVR